MLPEARQAEALALLGRLIARGVLVGQITGRAERGDGEGRGGEYFKRPGRVKGTCTSNLGRDAYVYILVSRPGPR